MFKQGNKLIRQFSSKPNPFNKSAFTNLNVDGKSYQYYSLSALNDKRLGKKRKGLIINWRKKHFFSIIFFFDIYINYDL